MPAEISVIIPTLNAERDLSACLEALIEGLSEGLIRELIVADGGSTDRTEAVTDAAGGDFVTGKPSRGGQLRRGCAKARGSWLLVLHADTQLEPGWSHTVAEHLEDGAGAPACFRLKFRARGVGAGFVAGWANLRTALFGLPYGDQGLLMTRAHYDAAGGYPDQPLMEDVALVRALPGITLLSCEARTSATRYQKTGWLRRGARNLWTLLRYFAGVNPTTLATSYRK